MNVEPGEGEIAGVEVVPVDINQGQNEALGFESSFLVNTVDIHFEVDVFEERWVEIGLRSLLLFLILNEVPEKGGSQQGIIGVFFVVWL